MPSATGSTGTSASNSAAASASPPPVVPFTVTVGGLRIGGHCTGTRESGVPVVILQSGNGGDEMDLVGIERHLAARTMVCAWSRPGAGRSETPADLPRPIQAVVAEMRAVLTALEIEPPYFPIGQSAGAAIVFMFAQAYPQEVAGFLAMNPNPPYTKWISAAAKVETPEELATLEYPDYRGENPERIIFTGNDGMLQDPLPTTTPYAVMFDEDCGGASFCDRILEPLAAVEALLGEVGDRGRFIWAKGAGHEIHLTQSQLVSDTIDEVWSEAVGGT